MGDSYRDAVKRRAKSGPRTRAGAVGRERVAETRKRAAAISEVRRKAKAAQMKLW